MSAIDDLLEPLDFTCPRCGREVAQAFYGPCDDCLGDLRRKFATNGRAVETAAYEPKMNVTPNAVALKSDD